MSTFEQLKTEAQRIADVKYAAAVLNWDMEINMPAKGVEARARHLATLSGIAFEMGTSEKFSTLLQAAKQDASLDTLQKRNVELIATDFEKAKKFSQAFVEEMSMTVSQTFAAWEHAKKANNFSLYAPQLEKMVALKRRQAAIVGFEKHPYDALLDDYEPGMTVEVLDEYFNTVRTGLKPLLEKIKAQPQVDNSCLQQHFDHQQQWDYSIAILKQMGYDFGAGRQDISTHPFTTNFAATDVRVTTRINEKDMTDCLFSAIHEGGHALYEQGLLTSNYGLPLGEAASLSVHESQSRLWENNVGRALPFWKYNFAILQKTFPTQFSAISQDTFYKAINRVEPSFIRTQADELTYHFHVMIRFDIEKALIEGSLNVADLKTYWNEQYQKYLGITPADDATGILQDVHWSHGLFGYFPTYSLGSAYAAQYYRQAEQDISGLNELIERGDNATLLNWLREKIHVHGRFYNSQDLCEKVTGEKLNFHYFLQYAEQKYSGIYGF